MEQCEGVLGQRSCLRSKILGIPEHIQKNNDLPEIGDVVGALATEETAASILRPFSASLNAALSYRTMMITKREFSLFLHG